jgi:small ligand-binding sensory domain FIST
MPDDQAAIIPSLSRAVETGEALAECLEQLAGGLKGRRVDALFVFVSPHHRDAYALLQETLLAEFKPRVLAGCSGGGVIGRAQEVEEAPALSVTAAVLPGCSVAVRHLEDAEIPGPDDPPGAWEKALEVESRMSPGFIILASPFMARCEELLAGLDYAFPKSPKVGGVVSGLRHVGERSLFMDGQRFSDGAVVFSLAGPVRLGALVSQGCRPVGPLMTVTSCTVNVIETLDQKPALRALQSVLEGQDARTRGLLQRALFIGLVGDSLSKEEPSPGEYLIRNVMGLDARAGAMAVAALVREGMRIRFHVRDLETAEGDLEQAFVRARGEGPALGGLLFSCLGRGERLFQKPDHDSAAFADAFGTEALGGFFCNGEIGPVGRGTYLHGFTSCYALFRAASGD